MGQTALVNGINYSWANIKLVLFGTPIVGIVKITYKKKQKKDNNYGMGAEPVSRGYGNNEYEASISIYKDEWASIIAKAPNRDPLQIPPFDIQVTYSGGSVAASLDLLQACEFMEDPLSSNQGDTKIMIELPIIIGGIQHVY